MHEYPFIVTISSEKGGVGKTTLATNLAIYLKAMREDLPVTIFSFDNHFTIDRMFAMKGPNGGNVHDFLHGAQASDVITIGQYGVHYIPSSNDLGDIAGSFKGPMTLARILAESGIGGIIIIDTRPDLNILTQNALYSADRVLIPVKDMPSLENCKNIFALFDQRGIDKKSMALLPCLVDERIKFEGVFKDQKTLLRAFAANRGYRCMDTFISKSPKVESLNTNPEGRIYPILTHARGTEVHNQFSDVARDILRSYDDTPEPRALLYAQWLTEKEGKRKESYLARLEGLADHCLICGHSFSQKAADRGFYYETSDRVTKGFLHSACFAEMLCGTLYGLYHDSQAHGAARSVIAEKAGKTISIFRPSYSEAGCTLDFRQYSFDLNQVFQKEIPMAGFERGELNGLNDRLYLFLNESLAGYEGRLREQGWIFVHPVDKENPERVLHDEQYRVVKRLQAGIHSAIVTEN